MIPAQSSRLIPKANVCDSYDFTEGLAPLNHSQKIRLQIDHPLST